MQIVILSTALTVTLTSMSLAHVPYLEETDFSPSAPVVVEELPVSKAYYGYLDEAGDVDVYAFELSETTYIHATAAIPVCPEYLDFTGSMTLIGPGLPVADRELPVALPDRHGAVIVPAPIQDVATRPWYSEPFTKRHYFNLPDLDVRQARPGAYQLIVWNEAGHAGDYSFAIGPKDDWTPDRLARARKIGMRLAAREELHVACDEAAAISQLATAPIEGSGNAKYLKDPDAGLEGLTQ